MIGKTIYLYIMTMKVDNEGNKTESVRIITKIETDGSDSDCFGNLKRVRNFMIKHARKNVALYPPGDGRRGETFTKMAECVFRDSDIKCYAFQTNVKRKSYRRAKDTDAIIVSQEGEFYANLLKRSKKV